MDKIDEILTRGVANIIPGKSELENLLRSGRKLNIYFGIDPTATKIHLGNTVGIRKLQSLAELGHNVTFLIGDFTALVGDTSDKNSERPILTSEEIESNFKTYKSQAEKVIDFSKITIRKNSEWLSKLSFKDSIELMQKFSLNDFISRELIHKRLGDGKRIRLDETAYPLMQGYDSYFMDTDLQVGGTDQTFNMQAGRTLQKLLRNKESYIIANVFLEGTDGRKMSKSWGNAIWLEDNPSEMYAKAMTIIDGLIINYFTLATNLPLEKIKDYEERLKSENPINIKKELAYTIVSELHSKKAAEEAEENFKRTVQNKELPGEIKLYTFDIPELSIIDVLMRTGLAESKSGAKRLIEQGGVTIDGNCIKSSDEVIKLKDERVIKVGKKNFAKLKLIER